MVSDAATGRPIHFDFTARHLSAVSEIRQLQRRSGGAVAAVAAPGDARGELHAARQPVPRVREFTRGRIRVRHAQQRGLQRRRAAHRCGQARSCPRSRPRTWEPSRCSSSSKPARNGRRAWSMPTCTQPFKSSAAALLLSGADDPGDAAQVRHRRTARVRGQQTRDRRRAWTRPARCALRRSHHREFRDGGYGRRHSTRAASTSSSPCRSSSRWPDRPLMKPC